MAPTTELTLDARNGMRLLPPSTTRAWHIDLTTADWGEAASGRS